MLMRGMTITFTKQVAGTADAMGNPTFTTLDVTIDDCLIAPISEPTTAREQQASRQSKDQLRVHLPKATDEDIAKSSFTYNGKVFTVDSDSVIFMNDNTPTRWNRYFRAECLNG